MDRIQGINNLRIFLESIDYPLSEQQINEFILTKKIPHSKPYGNLFVFDQAHIKWWVETQHKADALFE